MKYTVEITLIIENITKSKPSVAKAREVLENYVGDHIAVIGKGETLSDRQKRELWDLAMKLAPEYAPKCHCNDESDDRYDEGYADGYDDGYADGCDECECDCECHCNEADEVSAMAKRMIARINEILCD